MIDVGVQRAQIEHAIAVITGRPPSSFSLPAAPLAGGPPDVPVGVPSELLERRPDVATAERRVASANAQIGVAEATYRQTVLTAFQAVEDNLAALRILEDESRVQGEAVTTADESVALTLDQYRVRTVGYLNVITVQTVALSDKVTAIQILGRRMAAAVLLVQALGGDWSMADLPSPRA